MAANINRSVVLRITTTLDEAERKKVKELTDNLNNLSTTLETLNKNLSDFPDKMAGLTNVAKALKSIKASSNQEILIGLKLDPQAKKLMDFVTGDKTIKVELVGAREVNKAVTGKPTAGSSAEPPARVIQSNKEKALRLQQINEEKAAKPEVIESVNIEPVSGKPKATKFKFNKLSEFDKGDPYIDHDQLAYIHKGEAVIPAKANEEIRHLYDNVKMYKEGSKGDKEQYDWVAGALELIKLRSSLQGIFSASDIMVGSSDWNNVLVKGGQRLSKSDSIKNFSKYMGQMAGGIPEDPEGARDYIRLRENRYPTTGPGEAAINRTLKSIGSLMDKWFDGLTGSLDFIKVGADPKYKDTMIPPEGLEGLKDIIETAYKVPPPTISRYGENAVSYDWKQPQYETSTEVFNPEELFERFMNYTKESTKIPQQTSGPSKSDWDHIVNSPLVNMSNPGSQNIYQQRDQAKINEATELYNEELNRQPKLFERIGTAFKSLNVESIGKRGETLVDNFTKWIGKTLYGLEDAKNNMGNIAGAMRKQITGLLIAFHVMRILGQWSTVVNRSMDMMTKSFGVFLDVALLPLMGFFVAISQVFLTLASIIMTLPGGVRLFIAGLALFAVTVLALGSFYLPSLIRGFFTFIKNIPKAVEGLNKLAVSLDRISHNNAGIFERKGKSEEYSMQGFTPSDLPRVTHSPSDDLPSISYNKRPEGHEDEIDFEEWAKGRGRYFKEGGPVKADGPAYLHRGEFVLPSGDTLMNFGHPKGRNKKFREQLSGLLGTAFSAVEAVGGEMAVSTDPVEQKRIDRAVYIWRAIRDGKDSSVTTIVGKDGSILGASSWNKDLASQNAGYMEYLGSKGGFGDLLLNTAMAQMKKAGFDKILLTPRNNDTLKAWYEARGFLPGGVGRWWRKLADGTVETPFRRTIREANDSRIQAYIDRGDWDKMKASGTLMNFWKDLSEEQRQRGLDFHKGRIMDAMTAGVFNQGFNTKFSDETLNGIAAAYGMKWINTTKDSGFSTGKFVKLASGGPLQLGQTALVGERGPELLVPTQGGFHVIPNHALRGLAEGTDIGGGILSGGFTDLIAGGAQGVASGIGGAMQNKGVQDIVGGISVLGATMGALMAPFAGVTAGVAVLSGGILGLMRITRDSGGNSVNATMSVGRAQRSILALQLISGLKILLLVSAIALAVDWIMKNGLTMPKVEIPKSDFLDGIWGKLTKGWTDFWDKVKNFDLIKWIKEKLGIDKEFSLKDAITKWLGLDKIEKIFTKENLLRALGLSEEVIAKQKVFEEEQKGKKTRVGQSPYDKFKPPEVKEKGLLGKASDALIKTLKENAGGYAVGGALVGFKEIIEGERDPVKIATGIAGGVAAMAGYDTIAKVATKYMATKGPALGALSGSAFDIGGGAMGTAFFEDLGGSIERAITGRTTGAGQSAGLLAGAYQNPAGATILNGIQMLMGANEQIGQARGGQPLSAQALRDSTVNPATQLMNQFTLLYTDAKNFTKGDLGTPENSLSRWITENKTAVIDLINTMTINFKLVGDSIMGLSNWIISLGDAIKLAIDKIVAIAAIPNTLTTGAVDWAKGAIGFADGGSITSTGIALVHAGETITPAGKGTTGGIVMNNTTINIKGSNGKELFDDFMKEMKLRGNRVSV